MGQVCHGVHRSGGTSDCDKVSLVFTTDFSDFRRLIAEKTMNNMSFKIKICVNLRNLR
jgi:hypothetical protein